MNTTKKGSEFESRAMDLLSKLIKRQELPINSKYAKIYYKKAYFSIDRNQNIIIDISIEVWLPNALNYSLLLVVECKDYSKPIEVSELEEFVSKINQIAGQNVKGVFITTNSLQSSAFNYAKSRGIWIIRVMPNDQVKHMLYQRENEYKNYELIEAEKSLTNQNYISDYDDIFYIIEGELGSSVS
jgi:hypothetical protein